MTDPEKARKLVKWSFIASVVARLSAINVAIWTTEKGLSLVNYSGIVFFFSLGFSIFFLVANSRRRMKVNEGHGVIGYFGLTVLINVISLVFSFYQTYRIW